MSATVLFFKLRRAEPDMDEVEASFTRMSACVNSTMNQLTAIALFPAGKIGDAP